MDQPIDCQQRKKNAVIAVYYLCSYLDFVWKSRSFHPCFCIACYYFWCNNLRCGIVNELSWVCRLWIISKFFIGVSPEFSCVAWECVEWTVRKETVVVEEIKEAELRSRREQLIYDRNDDRIQLQRRGHGPSRLPAVKKWRRLLHKKRDVRAFVWKCIRKNTRLSSKIYCHKKCANSRLKRYKGKNVSFFQRESKKIGFLNGERCICGLSTKKEGV